jgi:hypothetical protein
MDQQYINMNISNNIKMLKGKDSKNLSYSLEDGRYNLHNGK